MHVEYRTMKKLLITREQLQHPDRQAAALYQVCALYDGSRMIEVSIHPDEAESMLNNIYIARVKNVVVNLHAAFVEFEKGMTGYLPLENCRQPIFTKKISGKPIAAGDELVVQVIKEAMKSKDAVVTTNLSFSGEYLVLTSVNHTAGISSKISGEKRRALQAWIQKRLEEDPHLTDHFGIILRTNAAQADEQALLQELLQLKAEYEHVRAYAACGTIYSCLRKERPFYLKMLTDTEKSNLEEVVTDDSKIFAQLSQDASDTYQIRLYQDPLLSLAKLYQVAGQIEAALKPRVWLKSGANLMIQPTEALTVIDVNSGRNTAKKDKQQNHFKINLEAAEEIAFQLRLRNLSGIIVVDFIDLYDDALNAQLMSHLKALLRQDPAPAVLVDITKLGLVEMTRKKQKKPLSEQF